MLNVENSSYFYGFDDIYGWGNRSYFTYYSEFRRSWPGAGILEAVTLSIIFVVSLVANVAILYAVASSRQLRTVTNYFIANLAVADITFTLSVPLVAATRVTESWVMGDVLCRLLLYSQFMCGAVLLWSLALISIDRSRCIVAHPSRRTRLNIRQTFGLIGAVWLASLVLFVPVAIWFTVLEFPFGDDGSVAICTLIFPYYEYFRVSYLFISVILLVAGVIPVTIIIYNYQRIFKQLTNFVRIPPPPSTPSQPNMPNSNPLPDPTGVKKAEAEENNNAKNKYLKVFNFKTAENRRTSIQYFQKFDDLRRCRHFRAVKILVIDVVAVVVMWLPITVMIFVIHSDGARIDGNHHVQSHYFIYALSVAFCNTAVNPILYGLLNDNFRRFFMTRRPSKGTNYNNNQNDQQQHQQRVTAISLTQIHTCNSMATDLDFGSTLSFNTTDVRYYN